MHGTADALRIAALSVGPPPAPHLVPHLTHLLFPHQALCRMTKHSVGVFQNVIEKAGLRRALEVLATPVSRIQQAVVTMFLALITSDLRLTRILQDRDFLMGVMRLLESPSPVIRAKAFAVTLEVMRGSPEMMLTACQNRLVMYIERDVRGRGTAGGKADAAYLARCLELLVTAATDSVPGIISE